MDFDQVTVNGVNSNDLSSDAGLLLIKEFAAKIGFTKLIKKKFKTNDKSVRFHKDHENLLQMIYQVISAYFQDDCTDELTLDPVSMLFLIKKVWHHSQHYQDFLTVWMKILWYSLMTLIKISGISSIL